MNENGAAELDPFCNVICLHWSPQWFLCVWEALPFPYFFSFFFLHSRVAWVRFRSEWWFGWSCFSLPPVTPAQPAIDSRFCGWLGAKQAPGFSGYEARGPLCIVSVGSLEGGAQEWNSKKKKIEKPRLVFSFIHDIKSHQCTIQRRSAFLLVHADFTRITCIIG